MVFVNLLVGGSPWSVMSYPNPNHQTKFTCLLNGAINEAVLEETRVQWQAAQAMEILAQFFASDARYP